LGGAGFATHARQTHAMSASMYGCLHRERAARRRGWRRPTVAWSGWRTRKRRHGMRAGESDAVRSDARLAAIAMLTISPRPVARARPVRQLLSSTRWDEAATISRRALAN